MTMEIAGRLRQDGPKVPTLGSVELLARAKDLLWVIARCDVENVNASRRTALRMLHEIECRADELKIQDLYRAIIAQGS